MDNSIMAVIPQKQHARGVITLSYHIFASDALQIFNSYRLVSIIFEVLNDRNKPKTKVKNRIVC